MRRALIALGLILTYITQALALAGQQRTVMMQPPGWVLQGQPVSLDWARGRYWVPGMGYTGPLVLTTTTRASTKYCQQLSGIWKTTNNSNYPAICDQGVLPEEVRTNDALWSRDMTQASWTLVGETAALNAVGIDGQANSASTLTATGTVGVCTASCTALQSITLGSSADTYSVWLKRITGSGAVNITINNLTGSQVCTLVTTAFTRCAITATLANPIIGIQMTAVGDVVVADFSQMEPGGFATSPILTTSASATRAADQMNVLTGPLFTLAKGASLTQISKTSGLYSGGVSGTLGILANGPQIFGFASAATTASIFLNSTQTNATVGASGSYLTGTITTVTSFDTTGDSVVANGGTEATSANTTSGVTSVNMFWRSGAASQLDGYCQSIAIAGFRMSAGRRVALSIPGVF